MARKETRIQMDGMCRVPSSRPVKDGMASESLNVVSDMGECVPVLPPELAEGEDIPDSWGEGNGEMVFVHVQPTYERHVYQAECEDGLVGIGTWAEEGDVWVFTPFMEMEEGETLNDIVGVGNTLVVSTSEATHYVLWKEGSYRDLGTELPKPAVQFVGGERERRGVFVSGTKTHSGVTDTQEVYDALDNDVWLAMPSVTGSVQNTARSVAEIADHGFCVCGRSDRFKEDEDYDEDEDGVKDARTRALWDAYDSAVAYAAKFNDLDYVNGRAFYQPYLFRYALRLYDGTYAKQSVPILVGGGITWPQMLFDAYIPKGHDDSGHYGFAMIPMFSVRAVMEEEVSDEWGDIVTAVDIFCSSPINPYDPGTATVSRIGETVYLTDIEDGFCNDITKNSNRFYPGRSDGTAFHYFTADRYGLSDAQMEGVILNHNVFYRIGSFLIDNSGFSLDDDYDPAQEFTANQEDLVAGVQLKKPDADTLVTHTSTASTDWDDYGADSTYHGNAQRVMNQRVAIWDIDETLGRGLPVLNGQSTLAAESADGSTYTITAGEGQSHVWRFCWVIDDNGTERYVWGRTSRVLTPMESSGDSVFVPFLDIATRADSGYTLGFLHGEPVICAPFAWLAYPDTRCRRVLLQGRDINYFDGRKDGFTLGGQTGVLSIEMREHPFLNCAYAWLGFATRLQDAGAAATEEDKERFDAFYEDRLVRDTNTIMLSGAGNPFTFPAAGRYTFDYAVVSCATANMPLSTGQFGDFPLYVFTKGGIWAMSMNTDGTFASSSPFSRDVAVSHKGVCEIDQGIVFVAEKAVLAIQGGQITDISQLMTGRHDPLPDGAERLLLNSPFGADGVPIYALKDVWLDGSAFMAFMADAAAGYDYLGDRMIFINGNFRWQWVWMRKTATWHRTALFAGDYSLSWTETGDGGLSEAHDGNIRVSSFVNSWPGLLANLVCDNTLTFGIGGELRAVGEMTSQLDRTRDESLASTGLYVSRPLTFDSPDVFKSIMDLRIRGDLRRGNAKHLLLSSNNGHDWVLRRSLRGPSFKFHRIAVVTKMTTNERLSYLEIEYDERFTNRLR